MAVRVGSPGAGGLAVSAAAPAAGNSNGARPASPNGPRRLARRGLGAGGRMFAATAEQLDNGTAVVRVMGEVDRATVHELEQTLLGVGEDLAGALIVDLTSCSFLDSSGLTALITTRKRLHRSNRRLALVLSTPGVLRIFQITALDQVFEIHPSLGAAVDRNHNGVGMEPQVDPARPESARG
jgi:anti-sigma B factor antagonist